MKKVLCIVVLLAFVALPAFAASFAPTLLKLSAASSVVYKFDGTNLTLPVTVTGTDASANFCVFTKDKGASIGKVVNGHLGWHQVNKIDTCIYMAPAQQLVKGSNNIIWDGKNDDKVAVPKGTYTYYIWAFDNKGPKTKVTGSIQTAAHNMYLRIKERGNDGKALVNPVVYSSRTFRKWKIGNDPADATLLETTAVTIPEGWGQAMLPIIDPKNDQYIYIECGHKDNKIQAIGKFKWVPNGAAEIVSAFGDNGYSQVSTNWDGGNSDAGVDTDGTYLFTVTGSHYITDAIADFRIWDLADGSIVKKLDISPWWSSVEALNAGAQMNGGPNYISVRNGLAYLSCHCSCMTQVVNPAASIDDDAALLVYSNGNGDYMLDHNYDPTAAKPWICNDYNVGPYKYTFEADANGFTISPSYDMGAVSFGAMAPDGQGIAYLAFAGETAGLKYGQYYCDNGSAFDGIYCDNNNASVDTDKGGLWFVAHDSIKGVISDQVGVADAAPAAFAVAQNTPNPFNPTTTINFTIAKAGKVTVDVFNAAGQKVDTIANAQMTAGSHSVNWNAAKFSAGVYFATVKTGSFSKTVKMTLLK